MNTHDTILEHVEAYVKEQTAFEEKNVKAAAARARKALGEIGKLVKERRKEIQEKKNNLQEQLMNLFKKGIKWPTLTELFFGKGIDPATDKEYAPAYLTGKGKVKAVTKPKKKPITEVTKANSKTAKKPSPRAKTK